MRLEENGTTYGQHLLTSHEFHVKCVCGVKFATLNSHYGRLKTITSLRITQIRTCTASHYFIDELLYMENKILLDINMWLI